MNSYDKSLDYILRDKYWWAWHLLFWVFIYLDEILSLFGITYSLEGVYLDTFISFVADVLTVYFNLYILFPLFFKKGKIPQYFFYTFLSVLFNVFICTGTAGTYFECEECFRSEVIASLVATTTILTMAFAIKLFKDYIVQQRQVNELETTGLKTELAFLKNQINPHFLFNSLNNIYVQTRKHPQEAPNSILQLSDMLRYQLYDCSNEKVPLKSEIAYINNFLQLDALRKSNAKIDFQIEGNPNGQQVAPFLFITFVENAIKHGLSLDNESQIDIKFEIEKEKIKFKVKNSKPKKPFPPSEDGGIGLVNVRRRLELLYPNKHQLKIQDKERDYEIQLLLKTSSS